MERAGQPAPLDSHTDAADPVAPMWNTATSILFTVLALQLGASPVPDGLIAGRVVDGVTGKAVGTAIVSIVANPAVRNAPVDRVLTDADGRYFFDHLGRGAYTLTVTKPGWIGGAYGKHRADGDGTTLQLAADARLTDVVIAIWRYASIEGVVTDDAGEPVVDLTVRAVRRQLVAGRRQLTFARLAQTDDRGVYRFANLVPGEYLVAVIASTSSEPPGYADAVRAPGDIAPSGYLQTMAAIGTAPISFSRGIGVSTTAGFAVSSSAGVMSVPRDTSWTTFATTFFPAALGPSGAAVMRLAPGQERGNVNVQVRSVHTFQISGTVTGPDGPAAFHAVHLVPADSADFPLFDAGIATTNASGAFTFFGVAPGQYVARVVRIPPAPPGYRLSSVSNNDGEWLALVSSQMQSGVMAPATEPCSMAAFRSVSRIGA